MAALADRLNYDVVVVGGGTAGCVLASNLSRQESRRILLLEAGCDYSRAGSRPRRLEEPHSVLEPEYLWEYQGEAVIGRGPPLRVVRGRVIGGSGAINGTSFVRGLPVDYDAWGSTLWSWQHVLESFCRIESDLDCAASFHGANGPLPIRRHPRDEWSRLDAAFYEAAVDFGCPEQHDLNAPDRSGVGPLPRNMRNGCRVDTAVAYLDPVRSRANLRVLDNATATRIRWSGSRAAGVEFQRKGQTHYVEAGEIILAAGAISSPNLLFVSGVGDPKALRAAGVDVAHELPGVGRNLRDHPLLRFEIEPREGAQPRTSDPYSAVALMYTAAGSPYAEDMQISLVNVPASSSAQAASAFLLILNKEESVGSLVFDEASVRRGPKVAFRYLEARSDRERLREGVRKIVGLASVPSFSGSGKLANRPSEQELASDTCLDLWIRQNIATASHSMGTCKLGPKTDPLAVVDNRCLVYGTENVRVADLSIAPEIVAANAFATALMIGERASLLLDAEL